MKVQSRFTHYHKSLIRGIFCAGIYFSASYRIVYAQIVNKSFQKTHKISVKNKPVLLFKIKNNEQHFNYPNQVKQIYLQAGKKLLWIAPDTIKTHAADAMIMLDCVLQYGLNRTDYHPDELVYDKLNLYTSKFSTTGFAEKIKFDMLLTDAILTFINDLHYGKLNPERRPSQIDGNRFPGFSASAELLKAISQKDFFVAVENVQPKSKAYANLQYRMHLLEGKVTPECYSFPQAEIRKMAINMERLRWVETNESTFIQINIPSFTLKFLTPDSTYKFKVLVGTPATPTLVRVDKLNFFTIQRKGIHSDLVFHLKASPLTNISGNVNNQLFPKQYQAVTTGYITIEQSDKLAELLLKYDSAKHQRIKFHQAINTGRKERFGLKKAVPVIITYLTLEINDGIITAYKDIYNKDNDLEMALYNKQILIAQKNNHQVKY